MKNNTNAVVLGMFETGLGVVRSLGKNGINVYGFDYKKDIAFYSRYVKAYICPHPLQSEKEFISTLLYFGKTNSEKLVLFITADDFLISVSRNRKALEKYYLLNLADDELLSSIAVKYEQHKLVQTADIEQPQTFYFDNSSQIPSISDLLIYPAFIKGSEVNSWRKIISSVKKGFKVISKNEFKITSFRILQKKVACIVQEIIPGPDTNHYKYCCYTDASGNILAEFTLRKIRQNPIHFGVGAVVESIHYPELIQLGQKLIARIGYRGIVSVEFKLDDRDDRLKLIEINPRYWQQNYLSTICGINFPLIQYLDLTKEYNEHIMEFQDGIKWVNRYMDLDSFINYRKEGILSYADWRNSLKGKKVYADFIWDDPIPALFEIGFGWKILKAPWFIYKKLLRRNVKKNKTYFIQKIMRCKKNKMETY